MKQYEDIKECGKESNNTSRKKCRCGSNLTIEAGDHILDGQFHWYMSLHCKNCGYAVEMDGWGLHDIPDHVKQEIINRDGEWGLYAGCSKAKISFLLKKLLQEQDICDTKKGNAAYIGTKAQVQWLMYKLLEKGIDKKDLEIKHLFM